MKTIDSILTNTCIELSFLLTEQTSSLLTVEKPIERRKLKQEIEATLSTYRSLIKVGNSHDET